MPTISMQSDIPGQGITRHWINDDGTRGAVALRISRDREAGSWKWSATTPDGKVADTGIHPNKATAAGQAASALFEGLANAIGGTPAEIDYTVDGAFEILANATAKDLKASAASQPDVVGKVKRRLAQVKLEG